MRDGGGAHLILWGLLFGSVGLGYFVYGRKQQAIVPLVAGVALMVAPYLVSNPYALLAIGCVLITLPFLIRG